MQSIVSPGSPNAEYGEENEEQPLVNESRAQAEVTYRSTWYMAGLSLKIITLMNCDQKQYMANIIYT